ncbi:zinc finger CCCH-type containing 14 [Elysia marginata]|uniref:Zinc finger CCCH domain-containing protein 14 n=1 Tax=Elysia marginata TaxID=1093978 RepID=A0AAV4GRR3_9GAST|nr:zinc finger CCCH-type containing 14 [Elysia marginata]
MSEAEKSIATKRKVAVTRPINRQSSPGEYSPKRKRSSGHRNTESPPPYIPSRKTGGLSARLSRPSGTSTASVMKRKALSRDDIRHTLGQDDSRGLTSGSRREEMARKAGNDISASSLVSSKSHTASTSAQSSSSLQRRSSRDIRDSKDKSSSADGAVYRREVRGLDRKSGEVKNFQITARVSPLRKGSLKETEAKTDDAESDHNLRVTVVSGQHIKSLLETDNDHKNVVKKSQIATGSSEKTRSTLVRDARQDLQRLKQRKNLSAENKAKGARVISKLAREAVQKQCKAAVLSVRTASAGTTRASSPDSRVVQCDSKPASVYSEENDDSDANEPKYEDDSASNASDTKVVIQKSPPKISVSPEPSSPKVSEARQSVKKDVEEVEDLSQMLEEDLDNELLLHDEEKNEFTLDLDDEELSHVVEEVAAEVRPETEKEEENKSGIRFIVTLDGVDEAQFDEISSKSETNITSVEAPQQTVLNPNPSHHQLVSTLPPSTPARPPLAAAQPFPQLTSAQAQGQTANKIRPPRIQPFSISLRDSDDEHEEKVVTYIQASDASVLQSVQVAGNENVTELSALQRARSQERCRYWPACMVGSECPYHHPTTHCKTFPNCKFGDKCLFIHPNCRFDSKCVRPDCPYTHTSKRPLSQLVVSPMPPPRPYPRYSSRPQPQQGIVCHFFPNCLNPNCTFVHPKPCMFGPACTKKAFCPFYHPMSVSPPVVTSTVPDKGKLKWQAQPSTQSKVVTAVASIKPSPARSATLTGFLQSESVFYVCTPPNAHSNFSTIVVPAAQISPDENQAIMLTEQDSLLDVLSHPFHCTVDLLSNNLGHQRTLAFNELK